MYVSVLGRGLGGALGVDRGWPPLPTCTQKYCDPASLVYVRHTTQRCWPCFSYRRLFFATFAIVSNCINYGAVETGRVTTSTSNVNINVSFREDIIVIISVVSFYSRARDSILRFVGPSLCPSVPLLLFSIHCQFLSHF